MTEQESHGDWGSVRPLDPAFRFPSSLSVFFPAYNDAPSLPRLLARTFEVLRRVCSDFEVIVVNDGSTDSTSSVLAELQREYAPFLRVVTHPRNLGYGAALRTGFAQATRDFVFYTDGDGQYDPAELEGFLHAVTPATGLVNGYKMERRDPAHRKVIGWLYNRFARSLFRIGLRDIDCDFRLIRRSVLEKCPLQSTSGIICVELVRGLELSGCQVPELPVHHYPRRHGSSQFFRVRSLATTVAQLCAIFARLVLFPPGPARFSLPSALVVLSLVGILSFLAYGRSLFLPFISDDYVQIHFARQYGPISQWPALAGDALYRARATSLVLTYWTERAFGLNDFIFSLSSLAIHIIASLLVFALGMWRPIGWKLSAVAACYFAVSQRHHEAVIWYAALPELLVFGFSMASFLCWVRWLQSDRPQIAAYGASLAFFALALLSKESAVVVPPLLVLAFLSQRNRSYLRLLGVLPFAVGAAAYFGVALVSKDGNGHFRDGTFSLSAPFLMVMGRSAAVLFRTWGGIALVALALGKAWQWRPVVLISAAWIAITLLPYSFLTYMPSVPSRHVYLASVGVALVVGAAFLTLREKASGPRGKLALGLVIALMLAHQCGYLWIYKHRQFAERAEPTERLLRVAREASGPVYLKCFPYDASVAEFALRYRLGLEVKPVRVGGGPHSAAQVPVIDLCAAGGEGF